jgi:hypothetical protein
MRKQPHVSEPARAAAIIRPLEPTTRQLAVLDAYAGSGTYELTARTGPGQGAPSRHPWWTAPGHSRRLPCAPVGGEARAERANRRDREPRQRLFVQSDRTLKACPPGKAQLPAARSRPSTEEVGRSGLREREAARRRQCGTEALRPLESGTIRSSCGRPRGRIRVPAPSKRSRREMMRPALSARRARPDLRRP